MVLEQCEKARVFTEDRPATLEHCNQRLSPEGKILVSRKGWALRITLLASVAALMVYNIEIALSVGDPLIIYSTLMPLHTLAVFAVGWACFRSKARGKVPNDRVSVIIPVFNQRTLITQVIDAIFRSTYSNLEVVAVNDGSTDGTAEVLDGLAQQYPNLRVIHKPNGGKRTAVASGFYASTAKFIVLIDSDSVVDEYAIEELMKTFAGNPDVGGVVGNAKVLNARRNVLTKCQDAWYDYAFNIHKTTESTFGSVLCCSGCLAAYRREAISRFIPYWAQSTLQNSDDRDLTSYTVATSWAKSELTKKPEKFLDSMASYDDAEDRALTAQALKEWKTVYVPTAIVHTEVPETTRKYVRQQTRWKKGYIRSSFYVSAFFWRKNIVMSLIFYTEFMMTFIAPITIFAICLYGPIVLRQPILPLVYIVGQLLVGLVAGLDYKFRDSKARYWIYKPIMNVVASLALPWLVFPAVWNYRKNRWLTR